MNSAFWKAHDLYERYGERDFFADLADHHCTGAVYSLPNLFAMAKSVVLEDGRVAWYVSAAVGDLGALLELLPWQLPFIAFSRRGGATRVYSFERFRELVRRKPPARVKKRAQKRGSLC